MAECICESGGECKYCPNYYMGPEGNGRTFVIGVIERKKSKKYEHIQNEQTI